MFNVTILKMKDIKKYFIEILVIILLVILLYKYFPKLENKESKITKVLSKGNMISCLEQEATAIPSINGKYEDKTKKEENILQNILKTQASIIEEIENSNQKEEQLAKIENENESETESESETEQDNYKNIAEPEVRSFNSNYNQ